MNYYVGGANAAGKSSVLRHAAQLDPNIEIIHGTRLLMRELGIEHSDYEAIRALPQLQLREVYGQAVRTLLAEPTPKHRIFDSHYLNIRRGQVHSITGGAEWVDLFDGLVLIYADIDASWQRIMADHATRDRALFPAGLAEHEARAMYAQYIADTVAEFEKLAALYDLPHLIIDNSHQTTEASARQLLEFIG
jgi:hypothetical protein